MAAKEYYSTAIKPLKSKKDKSRESSTKETGESKQNPRKPLTEQVFRNENLPPPHSKVEDNAKQQPTDSWPKGIPWKLYHEPSAT